VVFQVAAAPLAGEHPAPGADRPDPGDELRQVGGEGSRSGGVVLVTGAAGQPGLHRPRQRVARSRLAQGYLLGYGEPGGAGQLTGGRALGLQQAAGRGRVGSLQGEPRREPVSDAEDGVDRPRRGDPTDGQVPPSRELRAEEVPDDSGGDGQLVGVHRHGG
jgi:hypothetical protein